MNIFPMVTPAIDHDEHACRTAQVVVQVDGIEQVILFGSRARGDHRSDSDLDLLVVYESCRSSRRAKNASSSTTAPARSYVWTVRGYSNCALNCGSAT